MSMFWVVTRVQFEQRAYQRIVEADTKEEAEQIMQDAEGIINSTFDYDDPDEVECSECECFAREAEEDDDGAYAYLVMEADIPSASNDNWLHDGF